jgi:hypothetical protein
MLARFGHFYRFKIDRRGARLEPDDLAVTVVRTGNASRCRNRFFAMSPCDSSSQVTVGLISVWNPSAKLSKDYIIGNLLPTI